MIKKLRNIFGSPVKKTSEFSRPDDWRCFSMAEGKIIPPYSCEINAVDHCNIACVDCNHASPACIRRISSPEAVFRDLSALAACYQPHVVKIIGGEPLLHPDLPALIAGVRNSGINGRIVLVTNGLLLRQMNSRVWDEVDGIELSVYPETESMLSPDMRYLKEMAERHNVKLVRYFYKTFRTTFTTMGVRSEELTQRIYRTCRLANRWGCQSVHEGYFFKCPQCIYIPQILENKKSHDYRENGIRISRDADFRDRLVQYLGSREPLRACRNCLGSVGALRPHQLTSKTGWLHFHAAPGEEALDYGKLRQLESGQDAPDIDKENMQ